MCHAEYAGIGLNVLRVLCQIITVLLCIFDFISNSNSILLGCHYRNNLYCVTTNRRFKTPRFYIFIQFFQSRNLVFNLKTQGKV